MPRIVVDDVETTGLSAQRGGRVIEVGAVALENGLAMLRQYRICLIHQPRLNSIAAQNQLLKTF